MQTAQTSGSKPLADGAGHTFSGSSRLLMRTHIGAIEEHHAQLNAALLHESK